MEINEETVLRELVEKIPESEKGIIFGRSLLSDSAILRHQDEDDIEKLKAKWHPSAMLPKMYKDREIQK